MLLYLVVAFFFSFSIIAGNKKYSPQFVNPFNEKWRWHSYPELIGKGCRCMTEESNGNLWFGVSGGVCRYDGLNWDFYNLFENDSKTPVVSLCVASDGTIYAGTTEGISRFRFGEWERININLKYGDPVEYLFNKIPIVESSDRSIWVGSKQGALRIRNDKVTLYQVNHIYSDLNLNGTNLPSLDSFDIYSIAEDRKGKLWIGLRDGRLYKVSFNDFSMTSTPDWSRVDLESNYYRFEYPLIQHNDKGDIYVVSSKNDGGVNIYSNRTWSHIRFNQKFRVDDIFTDIIQLHDGKICIAGIGRIFIGEGNNWRMYGSPEFPFASNRLVLYQSRDQNLWITGLSNEVWAIDLSRENWATYRGLIFQTEDKNFNYWFITFGGEIVRYSTVEQKWTLFDKADGIMDSPVVIKTSRGGRVWAAGSDRQIAATAYFNGKKWTKQLHPQLSWGIDRRAIYEDREGSMWFGACSDVMYHKGQKGGLVRYKNAESDSIEYEYHLQEGNHLLNAVYGIAQSADGAIWSGSLGFFKYDLNDEKWDKVFDPVGLEATFVDCIETSPDGDLWIGTRTDGVYWLNSKTNEWKKFTTESGLSSNTIVYIFAQDEKNIWVATDKDFAYFDGISWTKNVFSGYFNCTRDGVSIYKTSDGSMWINQNPPIWYRKSLYNEELDRSLYHDYKTIKYFPDKIEPETKITFSQEIISQPGNVILSWQGNDPWKSTPGSKLQYSYRIDDALWSDFRQSTSEIFLAVAAGKHTFEVRARDMDFNVDNSPAMISFYVESPTWQQPWFISLILAFLSIITLFIFFLYRRNKIIQEISETKVRLFANISHELRTPLTLIVGPLNKVLESSLLDKNLVRPLSLVNKNTHRLLRLVNQVLDFRKMEAGQLKLKPKKGDIIDLLREEVSVFEEAASVKNIELGFQSYMEKLCMWFDPDKIEKITFNILSNALKYTPADGKISVKVSSREASKIRSVDVGNRYSVKFSKWLRIEISDTGVGIPKRNLKKIFDRFYQAEDNIKAAVGGTGIGLSIVKEMVKIHHGKIEVDSIEGSHTIFTIEIPLLEQTSIDGYTDKLDFESGEYIRNRYPDSGVDEAETETAEPVSEQKDKSKVLIVEDNHEMRQYLKEELESDYCIYEAVNGKDGFEVAIEKNPDLILSDIMMPLMDGIEFCTKIKTDERTSHIAVILLTARSSEEYKIEGLETGADDYLSKPVSRDELRLRIINILESRRKFREKFGQSLQLEPSSIQITSVDQSFIERAIKIIEENISDPDFGVERFSKLVGISRVGLYNKLKSLTGHSVQEFIFRIKLKRAAQLLKESGMSVSEITYEVGFKDPSHFSKLFKKQFGMSPKVYMNENSGSSKK